MSYVASELAKSSYSPRLTVSVKACEVLGAAFTSSLCVYLANSLLPEFKGVAFSFSEQSGE